MTRCFTIPVFRLSLQAAYCTAGSVHYSGLRWLSARFVGAHPAYSWHIETAASALLRYTVARVRLDASAIHETIALASHIERCPAKGLVP